MDGSFSPDGKVIVTGARGTVRFWDPASGKLLRDIDTGLGDFGFRFSPNGHWLAMRIKGELCLVDPATGRVVRRFPTAGDVLTFSADARWLAVNDREGKVEIWDTTTAKRSALLHGHRRFVHSAAFSVDGQTLITTCYDKKICRWDATTWTLRKSITPAIPQWRTARLSEDGQTLVTAPYSREAVQFWNTDTGEKRLTLQGDPACARYGLALSRDGRMLATNWSEEWAEQGTITLWNAGTGKPIRRITAPARAMERLQLAADGRTLLASGGSAVSVFDTTSGRRLLDFAAHEADVTALSFTADGRSLLSASRDGTIRVWEASTGKHERVLPGHRWGATSVASLPDGTMALSAGHDGTLRLWDLTSGRETRRLLIDQAPEALEKPFVAVRLGLAHDGRTAASFAYGPKILFQIWDLATGKQLVRRKLDADNLEVSAFSPDASTYVKFVDTNPPPQTKEPIGMAPPAGTMQLVLRDIASGQTRLTVPQPDYSAHVAGFSPDGQTMMGLTYRIVPPKDKRRSNQHALHLWELATGKERLTILPREVTGEYDWQYDFHQVIYSPDGRMLIAARGDRTLQAWDVATGEELLRHTGYDSPVTSMAVSPDCKSIATGHCDSTILVWDLSAAAAKVNQLAKVEQKDLDAWWSDLASSDARKAHAALWRLVSAPPQAIPWLRDRLRPAAGVPADRVRTLIADLDSDQFTKRAAAAKALEALEELAEPELVAAAQVNASIEKLRRIEQLRAALPIVRSPETLRSLRALQVLETVGSQEARALLMRLSQGALESRVTQEAKAAHDRLARRSPGQAKR